MRIIHFTTVHPRDDTRIRIKQLATLAREFDADVALYVQDGLGDERDEERNIRIIDTGARAVWRLRRMTFGVWKMFRAVLRARPDIAHFHDPELIPAALLLRLTGIKIVYDVHEDLPRQIQAKDYIPDRGRPVVAALAGGVERLAGMTVDCIIPATPSIAEHFPQGKVWMVQNFPVLGELMPAEPRPYAERPSNFAYVGGISAIRGVSEIVQALPQVSNNGVKFKLAGKFASQSHRESVEAMEGWARVDFNGWADRAEVATLLSNARAGLVVFQPSPNHINAQPNKLFEYMAAGIPVIASNFPNWRKIVEGERIGISVDPTRPSEIAAAMEWILDNPEEAAAMGRRASRAVHEKYNWDIESAKLVTCYRDRLGARVRDKSV